MAAEPSLLGQTGLINMPDARVDEEGRLRFGISNSDPYFATWASVTLLPRLEVSGRYTTIDNLTVFGDNTTAGDFRDKAFDAKWLLFRESDLLPAISVGAQDYLGTRLFRTNFAVLSKRFDELDITLGYGEDRIDGAFWGMRYRPSWHHGLGFVLEYDRNDYVDDHRAGESGATERTGGITYALEYRNGWFGSQLSYQQGDVAANAYVSIPLMKPEFVPKIDEPEPYVSDIPQPQTRAWIDDVERVQKLERLLRKDGFRNVHLTLHRKALIASLTNLRISSISRATGRAARILSLSGPSDLESIRITYTRNDVPLVTYEFSDLAVLKDFFNGAASRQQLEAATTVMYSAPDSAKATGKDFPASQTGDNAGEAAVPPPVGDEAETKRISRDSRLPSGIQFEPLNLRYLFNITRSDPGRAFHYDIFSLFGFNKHFGNGRFFGASARLKLYEDISDVDTVSDSLLPHVRTDIADYKKGDYIRLNSLIFNKYHSFRTRMSGRFSIGYYEEMFAGLGGQILYQSREGRWAVDLAVDGLRQREPDENFELRDYTVVTTLLSGHYRWPTHGVTATLRAGRFLAKDEGVRYELKRRFRSGVEIGAWYTITNGNDITGPGSPGEPYRDKGVFFTVPLNSMLTMDTREEARLAISPWTRDVGQMVVSPGDLYGMIDESPILDDSEYGFFSDFEK